MDDIDEELFLYETINSIEVRVIRTYIISNLIDCNV